MTTTDPFTEAANDEAGRLDGQYDLEWESPHQVFVRGAEWARTHLAAQGPQVTIRHEEGEPSTCEVRQGGVLIFSGRDHSADLRAACTARRDEENR